MSESINKKIEDLKIKSDASANKINSLSKNTEEKNPTPFSKVGGIGKRTYAIGDIVTGGDGVIIWNDMELKFPPYGEKISEPNKGYNNHFHTRYSGGALDINALEIVEYDTDWNTDADYSKHSQKFWLNSPSIKTAQNTANENIDKIGTIAFVFDADSAKWGTSAFEIDVEKCYFVQKNPDGSIRLDENGEEMKSLIYSADETKTSLVWDSINLCWRFYAVYAELP